MKITIPDLGNLPVKEDIRTKKEEKDWDTEHKREDLTGKKWDRYLKVIFALVTFGLVTWWITKVLKLVSLEGYGTNGFHLSDPVLITLLSTTSVNIFGYLFIVLRYLFNNKK